MWQRELWEGSLGRGHPEREVDAGQGQGALTAGALLVQGEAGCCTKDVDPMVPAPGDFNLKRECEGTTAS